MDQKEQYGYPNGRTDWDVPDIKVSDYPSGTEPLLEIAHDQRSARKDGARSHLQTSVLGDEGAQLKRCGRFKRTRLGERPGRQLADQRVVHRHDCQIAALHLGGCAGLTVGGLPAFRHAATFEAAFAFSAADALSWSRFMLGGSGGQRSGTRDGCLET